VKEACVPLLRALLADLKSLHTVMVQALLPLDAVADIAMFEGGGVSAITELVYMVAERDAFPTEPPPMSELQWEVADPAATRFQNLVRATYQGSLDCPQIDGWRSIQDVLTGYATVGKYRPDLWQIGCVGETEIGCLILADYPTQKQWELVYLGVHPQQRGRGWGAFFVQSLLWNARNEGVERVVLAVDLANKPARKVYFEGGFREFERRLVLAHKL
jgi:GNAT superfamily N-acetyltransferase